MFKKKDYAITGFLILIIYFLGAGSGYRYALQNHECPSPVDPPPITVEHHYYYTINYDPNITIIPKNATQHMFIVLPEFIFKANSNETNPLFFGSSRHP
jgi:hypothetical protein